MTQKKGEDAVSPVVGVMLMLVVTIIIAAVVSAFAGGLVGGQSKSPTLSMDVKVINTGSYIGSGFFANVNSVSEPIATSQIKIVTSWSTTMKNNVDAGLSASQENVPVGTMFTGGNTSLPSTPNMNLPNTGWMWGASASVPNDVAPFGMGAEVSSDPTCPYTYPQSQFGNYTLQQGVDLFATPFGTTGGEAMAGAPGQADTSGYNGHTPYVYSAGTDFTQGSIDSTMAVLGFGWDQLRPGDIVHVNVIYTPTGTKIFSKDVPVTEG
ncbi:type IV pilin N-terminal domain-containing protein [Methanoregula sp.]|uniref:type IV pilin N-terminal domain-containing protein n=1 Tax=Methanoregula sp. TaxID=2052170 RepID=UPI003C748D0B